MSTINSSAQYATKGSGSLRNHIYWLNWKQFSIVNNASILFITHDGLNVGITFSNVTNGNQLVPSQMNTWPGAVLHLLYDFVDPDLVLPALFRSADAGGVTIIKFTMTMTATRDGVPVPFNFVAADAEASVSTEVTTFTTSGSNWSTIEFFRNSVQTDDPLTGCGTKTVSMTNTYAGAPQTGTSPILSTTSSQNGTLTVTTELNNSVNGGMAVAFGIYAPIDRGDLHPYYGFAQHRLGYNSVNGCNFNPPYPTAIQDTRLKIGNVAGDPDNIQSLDDNTDNVDEEGVSFFPVYDRSGSYKMQIPVTNSTGNNAYLSGWFDFNRDGSFSPNELASAIVLNGATTAGLTWTGIPANFQNGSVIRFGFRFRLSSSQSSVNTPIGTSPDGEVEDYLVDIVSTNPVIPNFTAPDTVCVNTPVTVTNTSQNATNYYWSFCAADPNITPTGVNLGNPGGFLSKPVFSDIVNDNGNYYVFVTNNWPGRLVRLDFGNSLLNAPTAINLGDAGGIIPNTAEGIQMVYNNGKWYAIIVGGDPTGGIPSRILKLDFGPNITNTTPAGTNWGNIGNLAYPVDLHVFEENGEWYGLTINSVNNTVTRFSFTNNLDNTPTGVNLGNLGGLNYPTGIYAINDNGNWHVFIPNDIGNSLVRLDFGNSLLNTPTAVNLGSLGGALTKPRDIYILKDCDKIIGLIVNGASTNQLIKLDFNNDLTSVPTAVNLGNVGNLNFPHSISELFRVGSDLYSFITNVDNNTITRIRFQGCSNSSLPSSTDQNPAPITYSVPGIYNISLTIDDGLPTQTTFCKQVVVEDCLPNVVADFDIPDTVCINEPVNITNNSQGATSYYWSFCLGDINQPPVGTNLGNPNGLLSQPVFMDYVFYNNNYYGFVVNHFPGKLIRLDFGNSLLNTPTAVDLGNFGGIIPSGYGSEGIQVVQNEGKWYVIIVGGYPPSGSTPRILKIDFGPDLLNAAPTATNWGNIGTMLQPIDLHVFKEGNEWYGFTVNAENNTITRFSFTNSFDNTPTAVNIGGFGILGYPTGIYAINDNGFWRVFITNSDNSKLTRLDFGNSLLNTPTAVDLGSISGSSGLRDLTLIKYCDQVVGFAVNGSSNTLIRLNFPDLSSIPIATDLGNTGNLNFPHSISKLFRVGDDLYSFITNVNNNTITRLRFTGCTGSSAPNSTSQNPPSVSYNAPGTYNISLTVDDGLPTQTTVCRQITVLAPPVVDISNTDTTIFAGDFFQLNGYSSSGNYNWSPTTGLNCTNCSNPIASPVSATRYYLSGSNSCGQVMDSIWVNVISRPVTDCEGFQLAVGTSATDRAYDVVAVNDGYFVAGVTNTAGNDDILVTKLDFNGNIQWSRRFGGNNAESVRKISASSDGGVLVTGQSKSLGNNNGDILCFKVSNTGTLAWARKFGVGSASGDLGMDIIETTDEGYAISGIINVAGGLADAVVIKLDNLANVQWTKRFNRGDGEDGVGIVQKGDTLVVAVDLQNASGFNYATMVMKLKLNDGTVLLSKSLTPASRGLFNPYIYKNPTQPGYIISGHNITGSVSYANMKHTAIFLDDDFNITDTKLISVTPATDGFFTGFALLPDGGFIGAASPQNNPDAYIYRVNSDNSVSYSRRFNSTSDRRFNRLVVSGQDVVAVGGATNGGTEDMFIADFNISGTPSDWCDAEDVNIIIENPVYNVSTFTWPTVSSVTFSGTNITLTNSNLTLQGQDLCPCVEDTIINDYTEAFNLDICKNILAVADASAFSAGDTVLLIQMKGAVIDSTNTSSFGNITNYRNAGNYEFNYIKSKTGNDIELLNALQKAYDFPDGKVQLIRVPYFEDYTTTKKLTCLPWDGNKGGVLVFNVQNNLTLNKDIDVSGKGFRGGAGFNSGQLVTNCFTNGYTYPSTSANIAGIKGESIATISNNLIRGKGPLAVGGGGGLDHNSGGGGGGNAGAGGFGGYQLEPCGNAPFDNRGIGGNAIPYPVITSTSNKIFMGSGGGAGHANNPANNGYPPGGGNGGGIVIISAQNLQTNSFKITANGANAQECAVATTNDCHDGMGGGGGGGTVLLNIATYADIALAEMKGGKGGDVSGGPIATAGRIGPGGGGGGGLLWSNGGILPPNLIPDFTWGMNGVLLQGANDAWGATPGGPGINLLNLVLPIDNIPFKPNIDSVRINKTDVSCKAFSFEGLGYTNTYPVTSWHWDFGDNNFANTQNTNHEYSASGNYTVKLVITDINGCKDSIMADVNATALEHDFTVEADACDPYTIHIIGTGPAIGSSVCDIDFGDGSSVNAVCDPFHTYAAAGDYTIQYVLSNGVCHDTVTKTVSVGFTPDNIILTTDTTICYGGTKQLLTVSSLDFCWSPTTYLDDPLSPNPVTSAPDNITYYFNAKITGTNLITNGNFTQGNTGFTSQYAYTPPPNLTEGQYFVGVNPQVWNGGLSACGDHTTGSGNMMMVNGSPAPDQTVWEQTITVTPNTNYAFSTWIQALWTPNPAQLQFSINGINIGNLITASLPTCTWSQFYSTWNSGNNTSAVISIVNKNTQVQGNDFALDDISFAPVFIKQDSVVITVDKPFVQTNGDTTVCAGSPVQLNATGALNYTWSPSTDLSDAGIANPVATPGAGTATEYIVTGINSNGCSAKDTVNVNTFPEASIAVTEDTAICNNSTVQLFASGGVAYSWTPGTTLNDPSIPNPIASPVTPTTYYVAITDNNNCNYLDSVGVSFQTLPVFTISSPDGTCLNDSLQLNASGGDVYSWQPAIGLSDPNVANPKASPQVTTDYTVTIIETACNQSDILSTTVTVLPLPNIRASKSNDIDCSNDQSQLNATGGSNYAWSPIFTLSNANIANPVAKPVTTTEYIVKGTDAMGCVNYDTVVVNADSANRGGYLMPNAFTPNGDGLNDCYGIRYWGVIQELEFNIYNRWGERIFHTTDPSQCWDGTYKEVKQNSDVFVYWIRAKTNCDSYVFRKGTFVLIR